MKFDNFLIPIEIMQAFLPYSSFHLQIYILLYIIKVEKNDFLRKGKPKKL